MEYFRLFISNKKLLTFGILLTFFSGFGKTFLISQYIPFFASEFHLTHSSFSTIYALTTIASGFFIMYVGQLIDSTDIKKYAAMITIGLIISTLLLSFSHSLFLLTIAIFGLRLSGQGLLNHISQTLMTRYFKRCRGRAMSISVVGHALSEGLLPLTTILLITEYGWRKTLIITAIFMFVTLIPLIYTFLKNIPKVNEDFIRIRKKKKALIKEEWSIKKILSGNQFYLLGPNIFIMPFIFTGLMFYLIPIGDYKYWSTEWISFCFIGFACMNLLSSFIIGRMIDRFKAIKLFRFCTIPLILGTFTVYIFDAEWAALVFLSLAGISMGMNLTTETAAIAEVYGIKNLGTVKSVFTTLTIVASALGPLAMGYLLEMGYTYNTILLLCSLSLLIIAVNNFRSYTKKHKNLKSVWSIPKVIVLRKVA